MTFTITVLRLADDPLPGDQPTGLEWYAAVTVHRTPPDGQTESLTATGFTRAEALQNVFQATGDASLRAVIADIRA